MDTQFRTLNAIIGQLQRMLIPLFQRPYVWNEEQQWEPHAMLRAGARGVGCGVHENFMFIEPFAKFASKRELLPGRVVIPGSAGVPPAQDPAESWQLASQGWSVHRPTGAGAAPLQECGRDARAPRWKSMASQVQIRPEPADHYPCHPNVMPNSEFCERLHCVFRLILVYLHCAMHAPKTKAWKSHATYS